LTKFDDSSKIKEIMRGVVEMTIRIKNQRYYTTEELSDMLPLTQLSIAAYIRKGKIRAVKIGLLWYISETNLNLFLQGTFQNEKK